MRAYRFSRTPSPPPPGDHWQDQFSRLVLAAEPRPFWLDQPGAPPAREPLRGEAAADLVVIGAGFTGLWTALLAKESDPERSVVLVEGHRVGWAASGPTEASATRA